MPFDFSNIVRPRFGGGESHALTNVIKVAAKKGWLFITIAYDIVARKNMNDIERVVAIVGDGKERGKLLIIPETPDLAKLGRSWMLSKNKTGRTRRARHIHLPLREVGYRSRVFFSATEAMFLEDDPRGIIVILPPPSSLAPRQPYTLEDK